MWPKPQRAGIQANPPPAGDLRLVFLLHLVAAQPKVISRQTASVQSQELQPESQALAGIRGRFSHLACASTKLYKSANGLRLWVSGEKGKEQLI